LSEETDAVVVVVSEETGSISYAYKGHLVRPVTAEELRAFLTSVFVRRAPRRKFRDFFKRRFYSRRPEAMSAAVSEPHLK
jgi:diadenylate cyclase